MRNKERVQKKSSAGGLLRDWRRHKGMTLQQLSNELGGLSLQHLSGLEHSNRLPSLDVAVRIEILTGIAVGAWVEPHLSPDLLNQSKTAAAR